MSGVASYLPALNRLPVIRLYVILSAVQIMITYAVAA